MDKYERKGSFFLFRDMPFITLIMLAIISASRLQGSSALDNASLRLAVEDHAKGGNTFGPIDTWDTSEVTDMQDLFKCRSDFNGNISLWNTSKVTNMKSMFESASSFNTDISDWVVSSVTDMSAMFFAAETFDINISGWDVSNVTSMWAMFNDAWTFNSNIGQWDVSNVLNMWGMLYYAKAFNGNLASWDVSNVTDMKYMFYGAQVFDQVHYCWDVISHATTAYMFHGTVSGGLLHTDCLPSASPSSAPTSSPSTSPTSLPSLSPTSMPSYTSFTGPLRLVSHYDINGDKWCIYPKNNMLAKENIIAVDICRERDSHYWLFEANGKILNYEDKSFCISHISSSLVVDKVNDVTETSSSWVYSFNGKRILKLFNGKVGFEISSINVSKNSPVKLFGYQNEVPTLYEGWDIEYQTGGLLSVKSPDVFRIKSNLKTGNPPEGWCLYPKRNNVQDEANIAIGLCKTWNSYKWTIDPQGKVRNVKDDSLCLSFKFKAVLLNECTTASENLYWTYSVMDMRLVPLKSSGRVVTVNAEEASQNQVVKLLFPDTFQNKLSSTWTIDAV